MSDSSRRPRIVLYGIGQYGQHLVRLAVDQDWPIVAAYNRSGDKVGKDIGGLAGLDEDYGVVVEDCDTADYRGLRADVAVVTLATNRIRANLDAYRRLLSAGLNVICHSGDAYFPQRADPDAAREIDRLARANGVTFLGTGVWDLSRVWSALLIAGACARIKGLFNRSLTDLSSFGPEIMRGLGAGMSVDEFESEVAAKTTQSGNSYRVAPELVIHGLGLRLDHLEEHIEPVVLESPYTCEPLGRTLPAGSCAGMRSVVTALTKEGITITAHVENRLLHDGEFEHTMWTVAGWPVSPTITIERDNSSLMSAVTLLNRLPDVIDAAPGICLLTDLGPMRHLAASY